MFVVENPFLHMLPVVYLLQDVRVFRFNIDSPYDSILEDLQVLAETYALPNGQWKALRFNISVHAKDSPSHKLCYSAQYHNFKKTCLLVGLVEQEL